MQLASHSQDNGEPPLIADTPFAPDTPGRRVEDKVAPTGEAHLPLHVRARNFALGVIATVAFIFALQWSKHFLVPLLLGIFIAYTLNPLVVWLERIRIPRAIGTTIVTLAVLAGMVQVASRIQDEMFNIVDELPTFTHKVARMLAKDPDKPGTIAQVQAAAAELEQATVGGAGAHPAPPQQRRAAIPSPAGSNFRVFDWLVAGSMSLMSGAVEAVMVIFLVFFLLLAGDTFKRKLVKLTGPSLSQKKITVHILDDINTSIQNYMFMLLVTNGLLALLMWIALRMIGLENAGAWAVFAGLVHLMPYFGPLLMIAGTGMAAFMQFDSLREVLIVAGASIAIATLVGTFITTWMTGRIAKMNAAAVFVSLLFWGWLWGVWGMLLGVPVIVIVKVVAERVEGMEVIAELLGE
ncbi:AI-2E family transporter [Massilia arenosa]|uniref:AI-2E family transporter n=1 Tax=Zemynaea arenosa TaxID=2561931 RepID=A0A4Y9SC88_9BURK|nr:AI-2E family transporter [Massilia arenosa]TFW17933.1 AI-2E family transporter [Massilia arenosa]